MIHPNSLIQMFDYNVELINRQLVGMTHEESLIQPPFDANCLNWVLGHLISSRTRALQLVHEEPVWTEAQRVRYRNASAPIHGEEEGVLRLETLLADFNLSQERLVNGLQHMTFEDLCQPSGFQSNSIGDSLLYFQFHEAHHAGQIVYLGQLTGKPGAWLA